MEKIASFPTPTLQAEPFCGCTATSACASRRGRHEHEGFLSPRQQRCPQGTGLLLGLSRSSSNLPAVSTCTSQVLSNARVPIYTELRPSLCERKAARALSSFWDSAGCGERLRCQRVVLRCLLARPGFLQCIHPRELQGCQ